MKKRFSLILAILLLALGLVNPVSSIAYNINQIDDVVKKTQENQYNKIQNPKFGTLAGEWTVFGLARSNANVPNGYYEKYYKEIENTVAYMKGDLHRAKYTEYSRLIVALTAIGKDPRNVSGYDLVKPLFDFDNVIKQGINGPIWALIALDTKGFKIEGQSNSRERMIDYILNLEITDNNGRKGGFALTGNVPDPDITAMAIYSFKPYMSNPKVKSAVDRALVVLSDLQNSNGGYSSWGSENSESTSQVIIALTTLGIDPLTDKRFIKYDNNLNPYTTLDALLTFYDGNGGFKHVIEKGVDAMATDQALEALGAYKRFVTNKTVLFDMSDVNKNSSSVANNPEDINDHWAKAYIERTNGYNISNGNKNFEPNKAITRGEFAVAIVNGFKLTNGNKNVSFSDVNDSAFYNNAVKIAASNNIIEGVGDNKFEPDRSISRQEAMTIMYRVLKLQGYDKNLPTNPNIILNRFPDANKVSPWAAPFVSFNIENKIIQGRDLDIAPLGNITRAESVVVVERSVGLIK